MNNNRPHSIIIVCGGDFLKRAFTALCAVILVFFVSCGDGRETKRLDIDYPFDIHAFIKFDGRDYEADVTLTGENEIRIIFCAPESLKNTVLEMKNGESYLHVSGVTLPINDGGYSSENGLLLIRHLFTVSQKNYTDASVIKHGGVKYSVENYTTNEGKISAYFVSGKQMPDKISANLHGHEIELIIVND